MTGDPVRPEEARAFGFDTRQLHGVAREPAHGQRLNPVRLGRDVGEVQVQELYGGVVRAALIGGVQLRHRLPVQRV